MSSYKVTSWDQQTYWINAWNDSDAMSQAIGACGSAGVYSVDKQ